MKEEFTFPDLSLVVLIGASGSGKSTFAKKHFLPTRHFHSASRPVESKGEGENWRLHLLSAGRGLNCFDNSQFIDRHYFSLVYICANL